MALKPDLYATLNPRNHFIKVSIMDLFPIKSLIDLGANLTVHNSLMNETFIVYIIYPPAAATVFVFSVEEIAREEAD